MVVFPTPRTPEKMYACATRSHFDCVLESLRDVPLAHNFAESLGTPLPRDDLVCHVE